MKHLSSDEPRVLSSDEIGMLVYQANSSGSVATAAGMLASERSSASPKEWVKGTVIPSAAEMARLVVLREVIDILTKRSSLKDARMWLDTHKIDVSRDEELSVFEAIGRDHFDLVRDAANLRARRR